MTSILRYTALFLLVLCFLATDGRAEKLQGLFLGDDGHHQPQRRFLELAPTLGDRGIELTYTDRLDDLTSDNLKRFDFLALYANIDQIQPEQADALLTYVDQGGGFVPLHCASFCFRNDPRMVALMGAQFQRHGTGVFRTEAAGTGHELMQGFAGFESWDETYVHHLHNEDGRTVLEYRVDEEGREPWTWVRTRGEGRVFYTAWGHDTRTWTHPGFVNLVERGMRWVSRKDPRAAGEFLSDAAFPIPETTNMADDRKPFEYVDVGAKIPNYTKSEKWGTQGKPLNMMQQPLEPAESMKHLVVPKGFHVELFVSEPDLQGKPIAMAWDERGRLWVAETYDYPNELQPPGEGRDRIRICEDTDGDNRADKFTVFAEKLSIPTGITFRLGGVIVQNGIETLYLKDTDGDDQADERRVMITGWALGDTHGGVSNLQYGLDNWIWGMQGYNNSQPVIEGQPGQRFRMGFFRMRPDGSELEFIRSTNNNTWGLGISEEGLIFGSTANGCPSVFMPIPNRYYESVRGWTPSLTLGNIAPNAEYRPITDNVRQVDWHGQYTAGAGHALYTARQYPKEYWNRVAFVNGPTGHLVGAFVLRENGAGFKSNNSFNLVASDDEWTAPILSEVGPDGNVWVIDWYNYIVQHNPTPQGFETGKGRAYETDLRDKRHGRIYRVVPDDVDAMPAPDLSQADGSQLVAALAHPTMLVRKHAQRLLVERGRDDVTHALVDLIEDKSVDEIGLNVAAIHALWTLKGLGVIGNEPRVDAAVFAALDHPSVGVRRNAVAVLPPTADATAALVSARSTYDRDPQVRLASLLALADLPGSEGVAPLLAEVLSRSGAVADRWIADALTSASAKHSDTFLRELATAADLPEASLKIVSIVSEHYARGEQASGAGSLLAELSGGDPTVVRAVLSGLSRGWQADAEVTMDENIEQRLVALVERLPTSSRGDLVKLATRWGSQRFLKYGKQIADDLVQKVRDEALPDDDRIGAARQLVEFLQDDPEVVKRLLDEITPQTSPAVAVGIIRSLEATRWAGVGNELISRISGMTPAVKRAAFVQLLKRPASTRALFDGAEAGDVSLDELALDQKQAIASHPDRAIQRRARKLLQQGGSLPNADRAKVMEAYLVSTQQDGDAAKGKTVFKEHCSKCHIHGDMGVQIGPNLTGMAVHPKEELLTHILDPSRNVEGNFRAYSVLTVDGTIETGMLASESKTAIELIDTQGKKKSVLRSDIEELVMSTKSIMPEGFEKSINQSAMTDLLEFLTSKGQYVPVPLDRYATAISTKGLFGHGENGPDQMIFPNWSPKQFKGVPFVLTDPQGSSKANIILLHGPNGRLPPRMPKSVSLPCNMPAKNIHFLAGVGGWNYPFDRSPTVSVIVRLHYADGETEDHEWINGVHVADYIRRVDVPKSEFAFAIRGQQIRYLAISPRRSEPVGRIELVKGSDRSSPIVMAVTVEAAAAAH